MKPKDLVPCFYTGQDWRRDEPAELAPRFAVQEYKARKLGKFIQSGKFFLFFSRQVVRVAETILDAAASAKTILTYLKSNSYGDKLHYEIPHAGDRSLYARHHRTNFFANRICRDETCECHGAA